MRMGPKAFPSFSCFALALALLINDGQCSKPPRCLVLAPSVMRYDEPFKVYVIAVGAGRGMKVSLEMLGGSGETLVPAVEHTMPDESPKGIIVPRLGSLPETDAEGRYYVTLKISLSSSKIEAPKPMKILVTFRRGHVFLQLQKMRFTPGDKVIGDAFSVNDNLLPLAHDIRIDIMNPNKTVEFRPRLESRKFEFKLPVDAKEGIWEVHARYGHERRNKDVVRFEVRREAPEPFVTEVQMNDVIYLSMPKVVVEVEARYPSEQPVQGLAEIQIFIKDSQSEKQILKDLALYKDLEDGKATFDIEKTHLEDGGFWFPQVEGSRLLVKAFVVDQMTGNEDVRGVASAVFASSPYVIDLSSSSATFKKGLIYNLKGDVYDHSGNIQTGVMLHIKGLGARKASKRSGTRTITTAVITEPTTIRVETADPNYSADEQAFAEISVTAFEDGVGAYLAITERKEVVRGNETVYSSEVNLINTSRSEVYKFIYYMVTNKDRILEIGYLPTTNLTTLAMPPITINNTLAPGFHYTVFYLKTTGTLIADSIWRDVPYTCPNKVVFGLEDINLASGPNDNPSQSLSVEPSKNFRLRVRGTNAAEIKTLILDERQTRGRDMMITNRTIDRFLHYVIGDCDQDGGSDLGNMIYKTGVSMSYTGAHVSIPVRQNMFCNSRDTRNHRRHKRSLNDGDLDGISTYDSFKQAIVMETIKLTENGDYSEPVAAMSSSANWVIYYTSISPAGLCVGGPLTLKTRFEMNREIEVMIPDRIKVGQQFEVEALIGKGVGLEPGSKINASILVHDGLCTKPRPGKYSHLKTVDFTGKRGTVSWPMVALRPGEHTVEIIFIFEATYKAVVKKSFTVLPEGSLIREEQVILLGRTPPPVDSRERKCFSVTYNRYTDESSPHRHDVTIEAKVPDGAIYASTELQIGIIADPLGLVVTDILTKGISSMVGHEPIGCGEQSVMYIGPMVFAAQYQMKMKSHGNDFEINMPINIKKGLTYLDKFRNSDGSYSTWPGKGASTWLTAYVAKIFAHARQITDEPSAEEICKSVDYIIGRQRPSDGAFADPLGIIFRESVAGGLEGTPAMTAYVTLSLLEVKTRDICSSAAFGDSIERGIVYLKQHALNTTDIFTLSMVSYALVLAVDPLRGDALNRLMRLSTGDKRRYWKVTNKDLSETQRTTMVRNPVLTIEIETAAYALLALLGTDRLNEAHGVAAWLVYQHKTNGHFISTQDTVLGLQALTLYSRNTPQGVFRMDVEVTDISLGETSKFKQLSDDHRNFLEVKKYKLADKENHFFSVKATGIGVARLEISCVHRQKTPDSGQCPFNMNLTQFARHNVPPNSECSEFMDNRDACFRVCFSHPNGTDNMAILWVNLHHMQYANDTSVYRSVNLSSIVDHAEINPRNVIFYLKNIPRQEQCVWFVAKTRSRIPRDELPISYKIYDYHDRDRIQCTKYYIPNPLMNHRPEVIRTMYAEDKNAYICGETSPPIIRDYYMEKMYPSRKAFNKDELDIICNGHPPMDYAYQVKFRTLEGEDEDDCALVTDVTKIIKNGTNVIDTGFKLKFKMDCSWRELRDWALVGDPGHKSLESGRGDEHLVVGRLDSIISIDMSGTMTLALNDDNILQRILQRKGDGARWKKMDRVTQQKYKKLTKYIKKFKCKT